MCTTRDYYSIVLTKAMVEPFTNYLKKHDIPFESSEYHDHIYVACLLTPEEAMATNEFISKSLR